MNLAFNEMVLARHDQSKHVCVGLDPDWSKIPPDLMRLYNRSDHPRSDKVSGALQELCRRIINATHEVAAAFKANAAFFEAHGSAGWHALEHIVGYIRTAAPGVPIILDGKRNDIGNTCAQYAHLAFEHLGVDAVTVNPYLGFEALGPYFADEYADKGIIVICKTSNPGGGEFQNRPVPVSRAELGDTFGKDAALKILATVTGPKTEATIPLYKLVAGRVGKWWDQHRNCWLVVGATYPQELQEILDIVWLPILLPGFGAQGAAVSDIIPIVRRRLHLANSSSGIMFAYKKEKYADMQWEEAAAKAAADFNEEIVRALDTLTLPED